MKTRMIIPLLEMMTAQQMMMRIVHLGMMILLLIRMTKTMLLTGTMVTPLGMMIPLMMRMARMMLLMEMMATQGMKLLQMMKMRAQKMMRKKLPCQRELQKETSFMR